MLGCYAYEWEMALESEAFDNTLFPSQKQGYHLKDTWTEEIVNKNPSFSLKCLDSEKN